MSATRAWQAIDEMFATINPIYEAIDEGDLDLGKLEGRYDFARLTNTLNAATKLLDEMVDIADLDMRQRTED